MFAKNGKEYGFMSKNEKEYRFMSKKEKEYRFMSKKIRWLSLLILLLTAHNEERSVHTKPESCNILHNSKYMMKIKFYIPYIFAT